jgi:excisionase family DNA binding protein
MEVITIETTAYQNLIKELASLKEMIMSGNLGSSVELKTYTTEQLAEVLHVTPRYILDCRNRGEISFFKKGRVVLHTQKHVDEFMKKYEVKAFKKL